MDFYFPKLIQFPIFYKKSLVIYDLRFKIINPRFNDLKSLESNQLKFDLRFRFIIQFSSDLAEQCPSGPPVSFI